MNCKAGIVSTYGINSKSRMDNDLVGVTIIEQQRKIEQHNLTQMKFNQYVKNSDKG